jgi:autotransporter-associated beta strand protein
MLLLKLALTLPVALAAFFWAVSGHAQSAITFQTPTVITTTNALDAPLVYSNATLVQAVGFGIPSAETVMTASNQTIVFAVGAHSGSAPSGSSTELFNTGTQSGSSLYTGNTGSAAFNTVLQSDGWASGGSSSLPQTLQIGGLSVGNTYVVELMACDMRSASSARTEQYQDGVSPATFDASASFSTANPRYVLGTFFATAATEEIYVWQTTTGVSSWDTTISAFTLYTIPNGPINVGTISFSPSSTAHAGDLVTLSTPVSGSASGYQWYWDNGTGGASFSAIGGANSTNYVQNTTGLLGNYEYYFVANNSSSSVTGAVATLTVLARTAPSTAYWKGGLGNNWNTVSGSTANWTTDAGGTANAGVPPGTPSAVTFAAAGAANFSTILGANFTINNLTLSTANNVTIGGPTNTLGIVAGLTNASTALNNVLSVSNVLLTLSQDWENDSANPLTVSSAISGSSTLTTSGAGTIILSSTNNNYNGGTTINAGTLQLGDGTANNGMVVGNVTDNSLLLFANPGSVIFSGVISGSGAVGKTGSGVVMLANDNSYTGGTIISNGSLQVNNASGAGATSEFTTTGIITNNGVLDLNIGNNWFFYPISGTGTINVIETANSESRFDGIMSGFTGTITVPASTGSSKADIESGAIWNSAATIIVSNGGTLFVESASSTSGGTGAGGSQELVAATIYVSGGGNSEGFGALRVDDSAVLTGNVILQGNTVYGGAFTGPYGISGISGVIDDLGQGYGISCANTLGGQSEEFWGANTYHGTTTWTNGAYTLVLGNGSALQNSTLNLGPGQVQFDSAVSSNAFVFGGLTGTANIALVNSGGGAITLNIGNNNNNTTFNGNLTDNDAGGAMTKVGSGTFTLAGLDTYTGTTTVSGGKLVMNTLQTNVTAGIVVNDGAVLTLNVTGTNRLAPSAYTLGNTTGATNEFVGLASTVFAPVNAGSLTVNGNTTINVIGGTFSVGNTYPLISYSSKSGSGSFLLGVMPHGLTATLVTSGNTLALQVTAYTPVTDVWTGSVNTNWNIGATANWLIGGVAGTYSDGDNVRFDDTAISTNVFVTTTVSPNSMVVSNIATAYTFSGSAISGAGGLTKEGAGLLVLDGTNSYNGNTAISNGIVRLGGVNTIPGGAGRGDVSVNGTLDLNGNSDLINGLSGSGTVDTVAGGVPMLTIGASGSSSAFNGVIQNTAGTLTVTKIGSGTETLGGNNTYSGGTTVSAGTLKLASFTALGTNLTTVATNATLDLNGQTIGTSLRLNSGATLLNSSNGVATVTGAVTASAGSVSFITGTGNLTLQELWNSSLNGQFDVTNLDTGTLDLTGTADNSYLNIHAVNGTVLLDKQPSSASAHAASECFVEGGTVKLAGTGGNQLYNGNALTVNSGAFDMNGSSVAVGGLAGSGGVVLNSVASTTGTLSLAGAGDYSYSGVIENGAGTVALAMTGTSLQYLTGANTYTGSTLVNGGTLYLENSGSIGNSVLISVGTNATLDVTLRNDGNLTLNSGQTLAGGGTVNGNVVSLAGSTINPGGGNSVSILMVGGATLGGRLLMDLNRTNTPVNCDQLSGSITYGGTLSVTNIGPTLQQGDTFQLFSSAVTAFTSISLPATDATFAHYTWTNNVAVNGSISVATVTPGVNATPTNITFTVTNGGLQLSWPTDHTGWTLQAQTNSPHVGLGTNWVNVSGSSNTNAVFVPIVTTNGTVFYRMKL